MPKADEPKRIIAAVAKAALAPLGCVRKGQSRLWFSDQRFWAISVEFQPSGWSKGSYLNIGARWFWNPGPGLSFSYRPIDFIQFDNSSQFTPLIENMAAIAAKEVLAMRERFNSIDDIQRYLYSTLHDGPRVLDAAIASGLAGDNETSRQLFARVEQWPIQGYGWQKDLKARSSTLASMLNRPQHFKAAVLDVIQKKRQVIGLSPDPGCLDDVTNHKDER